MLKAKNILLISPEPWGNNFVSKHHYAVTLSKRENTVYFLNPPSLSYSVQPTAYDNLYEVDYPPFLKGLRYLPSRLQRFIIRQKYEKLQQVANCEFDVVWSFDNSVFYDFTALPPFVLKISHIVDLNQDFQTAKAARTADVCFCTTDFIKERLLTYNSKTFKVHHGYSLPKPQVSLDSTSTFNNNYEVNAAYVGNLAMPYIDWKVLKEVVIANPDVGFYFIGPEGKSNLANRSNYIQDIVKIKQLRNAFFPGSVEHNLIPTILEIIDIMLVSYQEKYHNDQASPHKIMEYLGSGKVVVATYTAEYKDKKNLIEMAYQNDELPSKFREVVMNIAYYNSYENMKKRKTYAKSNTYKNQIERIESIILSVQRAKSDSS